MTTVTAPLPLSDDHPDELLSRAITPPVRIESSSSLEEAYEIDRTVELLRQGNFKTIALQFPDDILHDAAEVSRRIQDRIKDVKTYILADTSYGRFNLRDEVSEL
jgi:diphthamide biosynthesis protein 2